MDQMRSPEKCVKDSTPEHDGVNNIVSIIGKFSNMYYKFLNLKKKITAPVPVLRSV